MSLLSTLPLALFLAAPAPQSITITYVCGGPGDTAPPGSGTGGGGGAIPGPPGGGGGGGAGYQGPGDTVGLGANPGGVHNPPLTKLPDHKHRGLDLPEDWTTWWRLNHPTFAPPKRIEAWIEVETQGMNASSGRLAMARRDTAVILEAALKDPSADVRGAAALALGRIAGDDAVDALVAALDDAHTTVRELALLGLGATGSERGAQSLLNIAFGAAPAKGVKKLGDRARPIAVIGLAASRLHGTSGRSDMVLAHRLRTDDDHDAIESAVALYQAAVASPELDDWTFATAQGSEPSSDLALGTLDATSETLKTLEKSIFGRDLERRRSATFALGESRDAESYRLLTEAYRREREPMTRAWILLAIGETRTTLARSFLLQEVRSAKKTMRHWAGLALGVCVRDKADDAALDALLKGFEREANTDLRGAWIAALGTSGHSAAQPALREALNAETNPLSRATSALALAMIAGEAAREPIAESMRLDPSAGVRAHCAFALGNIGDPRDVNSLIQCLKDDGDLRLASDAGRALGRHGSRRAFEALLPIVKDENADATRRAAAIHAIGRLLDPCKRETLPMIFTKASFSALPEWTATLFALTV